MSAAPRQGLGTARRSAGEIPHQLQVTLPLKQVKIIATRGMK